MGWRESARFGCVAAIVIVSALGLFTGGYSIGFLHGYQEASVVFGGKPAVELPPELDRKIDPRWPGYEP